MPTPSSASVNTGHDSGGPKSSVEVSQKNLDLLQKVLAQGIAGELNACNVNKVR